MLDNLARILITLGIILVVLGGIIAITGRFLPLGRLPGDIVIRRENVIFYFPVVTMIVVSLVLTLFFNLLRR